MAQDTTHLKPHEARTLGSVEIFVDTAAMAECADYPCTFLVEKTSYFKCSTCGRFYCSQHHDTHEPCRSDRRDRESTQRYTDAWRKGTIDYNTVGTFIEAKRAGLCGPLYHVYRKGRWYYYRFNDIVARRNSGGEVVWTIWVHRTNKQGDDDLGFLTFDVEDLSRIEYVDG